VICSVCNFENKPGAKFCAKCGSPFALQSPPLVATKTCGACQFACKLDAKFCPKCGNDFSIASQNSAPIEVMQSPPPQQAIPPLAQELIAPAAVAVAEAVAPIAELEPCPHCGAAVKKTAAFCGKCGKQIARGAGASSSPVVTLPLPPPLPPSVAAPAPDESKTTAPPMPKPAGINDPAPQPGLLPPVPPTRPPSPTGRSTEPGKKPPMPVKVLVITACTLAALLIAGGAYYALSGKAKAKPDAAVANTPVTAAPAPSPAASTAEAHVIAAPTSTASEPVGSVPLTPAPPVSTVSASTALPVLTPAPVEKPVIPPVVAAEPAAPTQQPKPEKKAKAPPPVAAPRDSTIDSAIAASLTEASQCMAQKKYDCVIANADGALRLDSGNARAQEFKRQAKEAQNRALSQIQIQ